MEDEMSKNIIFITAIDIPSMKQTRKDYDVSAYNYGIRSFKNWAKNNNSEVVILDELIHDHEEMKVNFQRYYVFDLLEQNNIDYDQILITDADCIIHPECPNFFELSEHKYAVTRTIGSVDWMLRSYENYSKYLFDNQKFPYYNYFNAGFHTVTWKGISDKGMEVPAGVYLYTIETDSYRDMKKMILVK